MLRNRVFAISGVLAGLAVAPAAASAATPPTLTGESLNAIGGDLNGGTAALRAQRRRQL
jgi:hypothetical protein